MSRIVLLLVMACAAPKAMVKNPGGTGLDRALVGEWVGVLEYRDYAEAAESTKRVRLPTWLAIERDGDHQRWHYTYDDGPGKTIVETDLVTIAGDSYAEHELGKPPRLYAVSGIAGLRDGRGTFEVRGEGTDNDRPAEQRITFTISRNALEIVEDTRLKTSAVDAPFVFRHAFHFTRAVIER